MGFRAPIRVCFGDIDNAGIVYYPRGMHYFHLAMEEFFGSELKIETNCRNPTHEHGAAK